MEPPEVLLLPPKKEPLLRLDDAEFKTSVSPKRPDGAAATCSQERDFDYFTCCFRFIVGRPLAAARSPGVAGTFANILTPASTKRHI